MALPLHTGWTYESTNSFDFDFESQSIKFYNFIKSVRAGRAQFAEWAIAQLVFEGLAKEKIAIIIIEFIIANNLKRLLKYQFSKCCSIPLKILDT